MKSTVINFVVKGKVLTSQNNVSFHQPYLDFRDKNLRWGFQITLWIIFHFKVKYGIICHQAIPSSPSCAGITFLLFTLTSYDHRPGILQRCHPLRSLLRPEPNGQLSWTGRHSPNVLHYNVCHE